jgi:TPR repeat protein
MKTQRLIAIGVLLAGVVHSPANATNNLQSSVTSVTGYATREESIPRDIARQPIYRAATEDEDPAAMYTLGVMFDEGLGAAQDDRLAFEWYSKAAAHGHVEAMNRLGILYAQGRGVPRDYAEAVTWYSRAVANGSLPAVGNLATAYFYGLGAPQSYHEAAKLLQTAAAKGDADAENKLGTMYNDGLGLPQDHGAARKLFEQSAAQGFAPAMVNLGRMYTEALGVAEDDVRGYALIRAGLDLGVPSSMREFALNELGTAAGRLKARQLTRAEHMAAKLSASRVGARQQGSREPT